MKEYAKPFKKGRYQPMKKLELKELIFVSGKGGTGKSTVAATLAVMLGKQGKNVLLVELGRKSSVQALLSADRSPDYRPTPSGFGFDWSIIRGVDCLVEYVSSFTKLESMTQKFFESSLLKNLINVAPGLSDLAVLGKLTSHARGHGPGFDYDHVIVDSPSTGSFQSLIQAPRTLGESVTKGPLNSQSMEIDKILKDKQRTQILFVSLYEELPVDELEDTLAHFNEDHEHQISVVMNKEMPISQWTEESSDWVRFLNLKAAEEFRQKERVRELWKSIFSMNLFVRPFREVIKDSVEGALRPI